MDQPQRPRYELAERLYVQLITPDIERWDRRQLAVMCFHAADDFASISAQLASEFDAEMEEWNKERLKAKEPNNG